VLLANLNNQVSAHFCIQSQRLQINKLSHNSIHKIRHSNPKIIEVEEVVEVLEEDKICRTTKTLLQEVAIEVIEEATIITKCLEIIIMIMLGLKEITNHLIAEMKK